MESPGLTRAQGTVYRPDRMTDEEAVGVVEGVSEVRIERRGPVLWLTIDRERSRNALSRGVVATLTSQIDAADADPTLRAIVLTGAGSGFCAGSDLRELAAASPSGMSLHERRTAELTRRIATARVPVIAAVEGFAIGGGMFLAVACDLVVAGQGVRWGLPEVALGWVPPWGLQLLAARVGPVAARRLCWGVDPLTTSDALRLGVVDVATPDGAAASEAERIATALAAMPPEGVASTKAAFRSLVLRDAELLDEDAGRRFEADVQSTAAAATMARYRETHGY